MDVKKVLEYSGVFVISFAFFAFYQFQTQYLPETDGYYHIKMAYLMREMGFISNFKWAHLSLWRDHFSDKEFLFHVYLIPFTYLKDLAFGGKIATVTMAAIVFTSFYAVLRLNNVAYPWFWLLLLSMSGGFFLYRVNVPRPQGLSIVFVLWTIHFLINRKRIHLAVLCFLYTYSYTAYHLPTVFALMISTYLYIFEKETDWKTPAVAAAATVAGMILSPYFPDNIRLFFLQNFYILYKGQGQEAILHMGGEFWPMDTRAVVKVNTALVIPFIAAFFTAIYSPIKWGKEVRSIFLIALGLIFLTCLSKRFAEYSVPVTLMFCAFFFSPYLKKLQEGVYKGSMLTGALVMLALIVLGVNSYNNTVGEFRSGPSGMESAALWLKEHTNDNELVYTGDWDDGPELLFFNHKNRYLVFLDPNFMYYWNPDVWRRWDACSNGRLGDETFDVLKNEFKVRYGVATHDFSGLKEIIKRDKRMEIVHESPGAYVFRLDTTQTPQLAEVEFTPPSLDEVRQYFIEQEHLEEREARQKASRFVEFFASNGWDTGNGKMKDWRAEAKRSLTWE